MTYDAQYWIKKLSLIPHIEGGAYHRSYTADLLIGKQNLPAAYNGDRPVSTAIYFLLQKGEISALHRLQSDECWHFYYGDAITIYEITVKGQLLTHRLGSRPENNEVFQVLIKGGSWFGAIITEEGEYGLAGCTVSPGFDFAEFEMGDRKALLQAYPQHTDIIELLTRG